MYKYIENIYKNKSEFTKSFEKHTKLYLLYNYKNEYLKSFKNDI